MKILSFPNAPQTKTEAGQSNPQGWKVPGFGPNTRIRTTLGDIPASLLRRGDEVITPSGMSCAVEWIDRIGLDEDFLIANPGARLHVVAAGSLSDGLPKADLSVSGCQVLVGAKADQAPCMPADIGAAIPDAETGVQYTVFHCGRPVLVLAEGVWCQVDELSSTRGRRIA